MCCLSGVKQILSLLLRFVFQYQKYARDKNRLPYMGRWLIIARLVARIVWFINIFIASVSVWRSRTYQRLIFYYQSIVIKLIGNS